VPNGTYLYNVLKFGVMAKTAGRIKEELRRTIKLQKHQLSLLNDFLELAAKSADIIDEPTKKKFYKQLHSSGVINRIDYSTDLVVLINESIVLCTEQLRLFCEYFDAFSNPDESDESKAEARHQLKKHILSVQRLMRGLNQVLASLEPEKLPAPVALKTNFNKNNKLPVPDDDDHIKREQLPLSIAEDLAETLDLTDKEMATILTISIRTYHRLKQKGLLNHVASERLLMLKDLAKYGLEVFEDQDNLNEWLRSPLYELDNKSPLTLLDTATGIARIKTTLGRIDYGVYS
jgi:putative toxin-antitoxin system antitoxin component (TIGR02293 family)